MSQHSTKVTLRCPDPKCAHEWETTATETGSAVAHSGQSAFMVVYEVEDCPTCARKSVRRKGELKPKLSDEQIFRVTPGG
jgi:hypothetical protein